MKRIMKWVILVILTGAVLLVALGIVFYINGSNRMKQVYDFPVEAVAIPTDAASIAGGKHLVEVQCAGCHGDNLEGGLFTKVPAVGSVYAPAIAGGRGIFGTQLSDAELVRAIRYGVGLDKRSLLVMPSPYYNHFSDKDLGMIISYVKSLSPAKQMQPVTSFSPIGIALMATGAMGKIYSAESINRDGQRPAAVEPGITLAYGEYRVLVGECQICHGESLTGGRDPHPGAPPVPDITRRGELANWTEADFITALRTGVNPAGVQLSEFMPWKFYGRMNDVELKAIWLYLQTLPQAAAK